MNLVDGRANRACSKCVLQQTRCAQLVIAGNGDARVCVGTSIAQAAYPTSILVALSVQPRMFKVCVATDSLRDAEHDDPRRASTTQPRCQLPCRCVLAVISLNDLYAGAHVARDVKHLHLATAQHLHGIEVA